MGELVTTNAPIAIPGAASAPGIAAGQLRQLATDERFSARGEQLASLATAVETVDGDMQGWDSVDLFDAFSPESTIEIRQSGHNRVEWFVSLLAAAAVFLPVAWTWFSMFRASGAYRDMLDAGQGDGRSFLQLWVTGFDGRLDSWHALAPMAMVSVVLIMSAVAMVVLQRVVSNQKTLRDAHDYHAAEVRLIEVLTLVTRTISLSSMTETHSLEAMVKRSVRELNKVHAATAQSAAELQSAVEAATKTLNESLARVQPLLDDVKNATGTMNTAAQVIGVSAATAGAATQAAVTQLAAEVTRSSQEWQSGHLTAVASSSSAMAEATESLRQSTMGLSAAGQDLSRNMKELALAGQQVPALLTSAVQTSLSETVSQVSRAVPEFDRMTAEMAVHLSRIDGALVGNQSATQAQVTELSQARDALGQILRQLQSLTDSLDKQSAA